LPNTDINCRDCWRGYYQFTQYAIEQCSKALKVDWACCNNLPELKFTTEQAYTYDEAAMVLLDNVVCKETNKLVGDAGTPIQFVCIALVLTCIFINLDPTVIRAGLASSSSLRADAIIWLENYIQNFADHAPNSDMCHVSVPTRSALWEDYKQCQINKNLRYVNKKRLLQIWRSMFPYCDVRKFVNVPGKCDTCYEIDALRKSSNVPQVQRALTMCHFVHRAGLFMLERMA
jgi:hypothetical protein